MHRVLVLACVLLVSGCGLFARLVPFHFPESIPVKTRYQLLGSMEQVTNAAHAELKQLGTTDRRDIGEGVTRFIIRDDKGGSGNEDELTLRKEGDLLVALYRIKLNDIERREETGDQKGKGRSTAAFKVLRKLPGVGLVVDSDGIPKDKQLLGDEDRHVEERKLIDLPLDGGVPK